MYQLHEYQRLFADSWLHTTAFTPSTDMPPQFFEGGTYSMYDDYRLIIREPNIIYMIHEVAHIVFVSQFQTLDRLSKRNFGYTAIKPGGYSKPAVKCEAAICMIAYLIRQDLCPELFPDNYWERVHSFAQSVSDLSFGVFTIEDVRGMMEDYLNRYSIEDVKTAWAKACAAALEQQGHSHETA